MQGLKKLKMYSRLVIHFCLLLLLPVKNAEAQVNLQGRVTDVRGEAIAFANIGFEHTSIGTVSNEYGRFKMNLSALSNDSLTISCLGYHSKKVWIGELEYVEVVLETQHYNLPTVEILSGEWRKATVGFENENTRIHSNLAIAKHPAMNLGAAVGRRFNLKGDIAMADTLWIFLAQNNFDTVHLKASLFSDKFKISQPLVETSIVTIVGQKKGWIPIPLVQTSFRHSGSLFASVEWVGASAAGTLLSVNIVLPAFGFTHYYRFGSQADWKVFKGMSTVLKLNYRYVN